MDAPVGSSPPGSAGSGTGTLLVVARVMATAEHNANDPAEFETTIHVTVTRSGSPATGALVTIGSSAGTLTLEESESEAGTYEASQSRYLRSYTLDIQAGADSLTGVQLDGPLAHVFSAPAAESIHPAGQPLEVRWAPTGAEAASIQTDRLPSTPISDSGAYTIAGSYLPGSGSEDEADQVRIARVNQLDLAGGAPGSRFTVSVQNQVEIIVRGQ